MNLTLEEIQKYKGFRCDRYEDVPADVIEVTQRGQCYDGVTLLKNGKEWAYELLEQRQPRTWKCLIEGSDFAMFHQTRTLATVVNVVQLVNDRPVVIHRRSLGFNPSDETYPAGSNLGNRSGSLPEAVKLAYYHRIDGMYVPTSAGLGPFPRLLPFPIDYGWISIDDFLRDLRLAKKYLPVIDEMVPGAKCEEKGWGYANFTMFLCSWGDFIGKKKTDGDYLFVKNNIQDGVVYYIRDRDVPGMTILADPAEAIDRYCEHVLLRKEGRFDFRPWAIPFESPSA